MAVSSGSVCVTKEVAAGLPRSLLVPSGKPENALCRVGKWALKTRLLMPGGVWFAGQPRGQAAGCCGGRQHGGTLPPRREETHRGARQLPMPGSKETVVALPRRGRPLPLLLLPQLGVVPALKGGQTPCSSSSFGMPYLLQIAGERLEEVSLAY